MLEEEKHKSKVFFTTRQHRSSQLFINNLHYEAVVIDLLTINRAISANLQMLNEG